MPDRRQRPAFTYVLLAVLCLVVFFTAFWIGSLTSN